MATIKSVKARQFFDSYGNPTVEVDVTLSDGSLAINLKKVGLNRSHLGSNQKAKQPETRNMSQTNEETKQLEPTMLERARAVVLSGASTCIYEAPELQDGGLEYLGKGVLNAVDNVKSIITKIDNFMVQGLDGTVNEWGWCKQKLGANAILAVSLVVCKPGASVKKFLFTSTLQTLLETRP
ncbi:Enolase [Artemisia annua]|uniref:Enolase n=1 Tax=Artemisia annua TaxID=35608 RepID=A0A2U1LZW5_ARTAN|nr:Enolase [Artemisia annua]